MPSQGPIIKFELKTQFPDTVKNKDSNVTKKKKKKSRAYLFYTEPSLLVSSLIN